MSAPAIGPRVTLVGRSGRRELAGFAQRARLLGRGGAGSVFAHPDLPGQAIKIYACPDRAARHAAKLRAMLSAPPPGMFTRDGAVQLAWPSALVEDAGRLVGFAMPAVDFARAWTLQQVAQPTQRARRRIPQRLDLRLYAARNLAAVLRVLHGLGHYVIDLKPQNVLVYRDDAGPVAAHVALVDCDGFQVRGADGTTHDAEMATPQFLHPSLARQIGDEASFDPRRLNAAAALQDRFALAVILFQLLNDGLHPMAGRESGLAPVPTDLASRLQQGAALYPYAVTRASRALLPDADSLHLWFAPALRALFDRAFAEAAPPPPEAWEAVLGRLCQADHACPRDAAHWRLGRVCGQCARAAPLAAPVAPPAADPEPRPVRERRGRRGRRWLEICAGLALAAALGAAGWWIWPMHVRLPAGLGLPGNVAQAQAMRPGELRARPAAVGSHARESEQLVEAFFASFAGDNAAALAASERFYGAQVVSFGKPTDHAALMAAQQQFLRRWPGRSFVPRAAGLRADCATAAVCHVTGVVDWRMHGSARGSGVTGSSAFDFAVSFAGGRPVVTAEAGRVLGRMAP